MRHNIIMFMITNFIMFMRRNSKTSALIILSVIAYPFLVLAHNKNAVNNANVVRDTQLLLSVDGFYTGPIDGQCDTQTKRAVAQYQKMFGQGQPDQSHDIDCNVEILNTIRTDLTDKLKTSSASSKDIDEIQTSLKNTNSALKGITDGIASDFLTQYNSLASSGLSAFVAAISGTIAVIALASALLREFITKSLEAEHKKLSEESINKLSKLSEESINKLSQRFDIAHTAVLTHMYARLSGHVIYMYKDIPNTQGRFRDIYINNLRNGSHMSKVGNEWADKLLALCKENNVEISDDYDEYICMCRNNFVFYVSAANDKYLAIEDDEDNVKKVKLYIDHLETMPDNSKYWYDTRDTIIWAKLSIGIIPAEQARAELESLMKGKDISQQWKDELRKRYDLYDMFPEHSDKVNLTV